MPIDPRFFEAAAKAAELQRRAEAMQWQMMTRAIAMGLLPAPLVIHVPAGQPARRVYEVEPG